VPGERKKTDFGRGAPMKMVASGFRKLLNLTADNERRLESIHHKSIHQILNRNMFEAEAERITSTKLRRKFDNIGNVSEFAKERQLN
jgi:hypothetical protein